MIAHRIFARKPLKKGQFEIPGRRLGNNERKRDFGNIRQTELPLDHA
jgi:hypothetical protein